jgi:hypothetical protein
LLFCISLWCSQGKDDQETVLQQRFQQVQWHTGVRKTMFSTVFIGSNQE